MFCTFLCFLNCVPFKLGKLYAIEKYCINFDHSLLQCSPPPSKSFRHPAQTLPLLPFSLSTDLCVLRTDAVGFEYLAGSVVGVWIYLRGFSLPHQTAFPPEYFPYVFSIIVHSDLEALCPKCQVIEVVVNNSRRKTNCLSCFIISTNTYWELRLKC